MLNSIGRLIRQRRQSLNMTIEALAEKSQSSVSLISLIERGKLDNIKINKLNDIAEALNLTLGDFFIDSKLQQSTTLELIHYLAKLPKETQEKVADALLTVLKL